MKCPACSADIPLGFRFCGDCGAALTTSGEPLGERRGRDAGLDRPAPGTTVSAQGERRQVTVLFSDLVGSLAISTQLDPEELHELIRAYRSVCAGVVERFGGYVAQYLGDGILAYFGFPTAHEDDAERAV
ncbi:MAG TPA: adenylate/guanylate cyclase domain-containing protein, partial [Candidatus Methylomirabilis sp.]|nr:adenylate/guanylate cyclase domain-containing protein [Candidatus Methylomirabilis sp.]